MHVCNKSSRGHQTLDKWPGDYVLLNFSLETGDDQQVFDTFEIPAECAHLLYRDYSFLELGDNVSNSPRSSQPGTKLLSSQRRTKPPSSSLRRNQKTRQILENLLLMKNLY